MEREYTVVIKGPIPGDLSEKISRFHAEAIRHKKAEGNGGQGGGWRGGAAPSSNGGVVQSALPSDGAGLSQEPVLEGLLLKAGALDAEGCQTLTPSPENTVPRARPAASDGNPGLEKDREIWR